MAKATANFSATLLRSFATLKQLPTGTQSAQYSSRIMAEIIKPMESSIKKKLTETFKPAVLEIINESYMHNVPKGSETHFKVVVVSDVFEGVPLVQRHRQVNTTLGEELGSGLHALSIVAKTPSQWEKSSKEIGSSPACRGGSGL